MNLAQLHSIYFLGIGGIGMSALARYFHHRGIVVSGYDRTRTPLIDSLEEAGMSVSDRVQISDLQPVDLIIYTPAIRPGSPEFQTALRTGKPMLKRAEVLGKISREGKALAIAGTHGKTTTSAMLTHLLRQSGVDCTAFLGGISRNLNSNYAGGKSPWVVLEADEYDRSFLHLHPEWAAISALDPDHLDIYKSGREMISSYQAFAGQARQVLVNVDLENESWPKGTETYGIARGDHQACNLSYEGFHSRFDYKGKDEALEGLALAMPGRHNVANMTAALTLALKAGAQAERLREAVASFTGIVRRFELRLDLPTLTFIDDYAHHPKEIEAVLGTVRDLYPDRKVVVVFQPHLYTRTRDFAGEFAQALSKADVVRLMDIYPAREAPIPGVDSQMILEGIQGPDKKLIQRNELPTVLVADTREPSVLLTLGAGDIDKELNTVEQALRAAIGKL